MKSVILEEEADFKQEQIRFLENKLYRENCLVKFIAKTHIKFRALTTIFFLQNSSLKTNFLNFLMILFLVQPLALTIHTKCLNDKIHQFLTFT